MNTHYLKAFFSFVCLFSLSTYAQQPLDYVNLYIGTDGSHATEYGGTTPAVSEPFGMTQWCAVTRENGISRTMYHHQDHTLIGFMATHQPAIWMGDYCFFTLMPQIDQLQTVPADRKVVLDRKKEIATPYYYQVEYTGHGNAPIKTEFTATSRASFFKITYPSAHKAILYLEASREKGKGGIKIYPEKQEIHLYNQERHDAHLGPQLPHLQGYYVLKFSQPFSAYDQEDHSSQECGFVEFPAHTEVVEVKIGSSLISYEQASDNLAQEIPAKATFTQTVKKVKKKWAEKLAKVKIKNASEDDLTVFYTAFFRTLQYPREFSEYGRYYSPFDDKIHTGISYNAYSLWDTFRAQHPWLLLTCPERVNDMVTALIQMYEEGGWIPKWPNPTYTNIMIGTHADAVIADAYVNGYRDYDLRKAYAAIRKNAYTPPAHDEQYRWGDRNHWNGSYEARSGLTNYLEQGFVASDKTDEAVARTLEFTLDDYCIAQMAKDLGHQKDFEDLMRRSNNYRNLYNPETGFFQARKKDGNWDKSDVGFTEGANWTYQFCVMQDVPGMISLMGGSDQFIQKMDRVFDSHNYRHDNEPCHHYVYLYNFCNRLDKTQQRIPEILATNYQNKPDGLSGNDDCGQMSAWYLFSSLGFYPVTPASSQYALGIPKFEEITLQLPNHKTLKIIARNLSTHRTLTKVKFNGEILETPFLSVKEVLKGGILEFLP